MSFEDITRQLEATDRMLCRAKELFEAGQLGKAERAYKKILNDVVELYGPESLKTCTCLSELAEIAYAQESYAEVITLLEQVIITNCRTSILTNEQMLSIHFKLAKAFEKSNNIHEAYGVYSDLLKKSQQVLGPNAP
ncbi:MAG: tetratricopeptide repeat protein, partial [Candidatus Obscuribacterales bacterium]|nr:tetratricopeptide repeat protein [Candidatus Obscuribacterales bacterium]